MTDRPPTLGMILKGYPRISESFISNEILLLEECGIPVRIFSMRHPRELFCHESVRRIKAHVDYLPTELFLDFPRLFGASTLLAVRRPRQFLAALHFAAPRFARTRNLGTVKHLLQAAYLTNQVLLHAPEVIHLHAHFAHSPTSVAQFAGILSGLDFSFTAHAKDIYTANPEHLAEKIEKAAFVVTCTQQNQSFLEHLRAAAATPIYCVYHGIDLDLFNDPITQHVPQEPYKILTVARFTEKKGIPTILAALHQLKQENIRFEYTLIGDGEQRDALMNLLMQYDLKDCCRWLGTLSHEKVITEFSRTDLFVLGCRISSNGDRDGIPNVLVESLAMGVPAIGTRVSALPEILLNETTGLLVEPDDPHAMASAIKRILTDSLLRKNIVEKGRERVNASFNNRVLIKELASCYRRHIPALGTIDVL